MVINKEIDLEKLKKETDVNIIKDTLLKFPGVGEKVADCIILFSLNSFSVFPVDVWVRRVMNELYLKESFSYLLSSDELDDIHTLVYLYSSPKKNSFGEVRIQLGNKEIGKLFVYGKNK